MKRVSDEIVSSELVKCCVRRLPPSSSSSSACMSKHAIYPRTRCRADTRYPSVRSKWRSSTTWMSRAWRYCGRPFALIARNKCDASSRNKLPNNVLLSLSLSPPLFPPLLSHACSLTPSLCAFLSHVAKMSVPIADTWNRGQAAALIVVTCDIESTYEIWSNSWRASSISGEIRGGWSGWRTEKRRNFDSKKCDSHNRLFWERKASSHDYLDVERSIMESLITLMKWIRCIELMTFTSARSGWNVTLGFFRSTLAWSKFGQSFSYLSWHSMWQTWWTSLNSA